MLMVSFFFLKGKAAFAKAGINWETDVIRALPVSVVPDPTLDEFVSDVSADEIGAARVTLAGAAVNEDAANDEAELDANDFTHPAVASGSTYVGTVLYKQVGGSDATPADDQLIMFLDGDDTPTNGGDIDVTLAAEGAGKF